MSEVERYEGSWQAAELEELAERINTEHHASVGSFNAGLVHALEAGRLLAEVKASLPHGEFGPWLAINFAGSDRTARAYLRLHDHRDEIEAKRQSSATLSIDRALRMLRPPKPPPLWQRDLPFDPEQMPGPDPEVLRGMEAEEEAWLPYREAMERERREDEERTRAAVRAEELRGIVEALDGLVPGYRPEEGGTELARATGNGRAITVLREGLAWLQRVLEEAEAMRERER